MALIKPITSIVEADLQELIDHQVAEKKTLEFKSKISLNTEKEKKEFLADVSSFANASGGHLIYGMEESNGIATKLPGLSGLDPDQEKLRLESLIRDGISPRIIGISTHSVDLKNGNCAIVIYIPQSWTSPHMVVYQGTSRFFTRSSAGKYQMDVQEIRQSFLASGNVSDKIRDFRLERLSRISMLDTPVPLAEGTKLVLHAIPLSAFQSVPLIDLKQAARDIPRYMQDTGMFRYNLDGLVSFGVIPENGYSRYEQIFRNGVIEFVEWQLLAMDNTIPELFERVIIENCKSILEFQQSLGFEPPIFIFAAFLNVKNRKMGGNSMGFVQKAYFNKEIDRNDLLLPEIIIDDYSSTTNLSSILRPIFDACWNACGWPGSIHYDENGKYLY
jgi:hypothetical protein